MVDDLALLTDTINQATTLLYSLENAVKRIGLHIDAKELNSPSTTKKEPSPH